MEILSQNRANPSASCEAYINDPTKTVNFGGKAFRFVPMNVIKEVASENNIEEFMGLFGLNSSAMNTLKKKISRTVYYCLL